MKINGHLSDKEILRLPLHQFSNRWRRKERKRRSHQHGGGPGGGAGADVDGLEGGMAGVSLRGGGGEGDEAEEANNAKGSIHI